MISIPPNHFVIVANPVLSNVNLLENDYSKRRFTLESTKYRHSVQEVRTIAKYSVPFPLYPGMFHTMNDGFAENDHVAINLKCRGNSASRFEESGIYLRKGSSCIKITC